MYNFFNFIWVLFFGWHQIHSLIIYCTEHFHPGYWRMDRHDFTFYRSSVAFKFCTLFCCWDSQNFTMDRNYSCSVLHFLNNFAKIFKIFISVFVFQSSSFCTFSHITLVFKLHIFYTCWHCPHKFYWCSEFDHRKVQYNRYSIYSLLIAP